MPNRVWDEITFPFPNFNGSTVEVWEWISNFIPHFIMGGVTLLALGQSYQISADLFKYEDFEIWGVNNETNINFKYLLTLQIPYSFDGSFVVWPQHSPIHLICCRCISLSKNTIWLSIEFSFAVKSIFLGAWVVRYISEDVFHRIVSGPQWTFRIKFDRNIACHSNEPGPSVALILNEMICRKIARCFETWTRVDVSIFFKI